MEQTEDKKMKEKEYYSKTTLIKYRSWTEKAIKLFLGKHDKEGKNPYYASASPTKLFLIKRVEKKEKTKDFKDFKNKNENKKKGSEKAVKTKKKKIINFIDNLNIQVKKEDFKIVKQGAIESYNKFKEDISFEIGFDFQKATLNSDKQFLNRIIVNYLRHNLSEYDYRLQEIFGKVGKQEAYKLLNKKIYDKISEVYPQLKQECLNQLSKK